MTDVLMLDHVIARAPQGVSMPKPRDRTGWFPVVAKHGNAGRVFFCHVMDGPKGLAVIKRRARYALRDLEHHARMMAWTKEQGDQLEAPLRRIIASARSGGDPS